MDVAADLHHQTFKGCPLARQPRAVLLCLRMKRLLILLLVSISLSASPGDSYQSLFMIERSTNANVERDYDPPAQVVLIEERRLDSQLVALDVFLD